MIARSDPRQIKRPGSSTTLFAVAIAAENALTDDVLPRGRGLFVEVAMGYPLGLVAGDAGCVIGQAAQRPSEAFQ